MLTCRYGFREARGLIPVLRTPASPGVCIWSARAAALAWCDLVGDHPAKGSSGRGQLPGPRRGPDDDAEPAAADIPAIDTDIDSGELDGSLAGTATKADSGGDRSVSVSCERRRFGGSL